MACGRLFGGRIKQGFVFHLCSDLSGDVIMLYLFITPRRRTGSCAHSGAEVPGGGVGVGGSRGSCSLPFLPLLFAKCRGLRGEEGSSVGARKGALVWMRGSQGLGGVIHLCPLGRRCWVYLAGEGSGHSWYPPLRGRQHHPSPARWHVPAGACSPRSVSRSPLHRDPPRHDGPGGRGRGDGVLLPRQRLPLLLP